jgi:hypothetical protein
MTRLIIALVLITTAATAQTTNCITDPNSGLVTCSSSGTFGPTTTTSCITDPNSGMMTCTTN